VSADIIIKVTPGYFSSPSTNESNISQSREREGGREGGREVLMW
jgi:hypothetical protein